jgi:hypothetical protein
MAVSTRPDRRPSVPGGWLTRYARPCDIGHHGVSRSGHLARVTAATIGLSQTPAPVAERTTTAPSHHWPATELPQAHDHPSQLAQPVTTSAYVPEAKPVPQESPRQQLNGRPRADSTTGAVAR